jgi:hypothetical protein
MSGTTLLLNLFLALAVITCTAQTDTPVLRVYAYERPVVSGIPGGPPGGAAPSQRKQYSIYLETRPNATLVVEGVWMDQKEFAVKTAVRNSPVKFDTPVVLDNGRDIAVPVTKNKVTEILVSEAIPGKTPSPKVAELLKDNQAIVQLTSNGSTMFAPIKNFEVRDPVFLK